MATSFDLLRTSRFGGGGLLGLNRPLTPEEEDELLRQQMLATDPLAPLPAAPTDQPFVKPVEEEEKIRVDDRPLVIPNEAPAFQQDTAPIIPDQPLPDDKAILKPPKPLVQPSDDPPLVQSADPVASIESVMQSLTDSLEKSPTPVTRSLLVAARQRRAEIEEELKSTKPVSTSVLQGAYDDAVQQAINGELWKATPGEMLSFAKKLANDVYDGQVQTNWTLGSFSDIAKYRAKGGTSPSSLNVPSEPGKPVDQDVAALAKGAASTREVLWGGIEAVQEATGLGDTKKAEERRKYYNSIAKQLPEGTRLEDVKSLGEAVQFARQVTEENVSNLALSISGGVVGGVIRGSLGAQLGAFGPSFLMETGSIESQNKELNPEQKASLATILSGSAAALLDTVLPGKIGAQLTERIGKEAAEDVAMKMLMMSPSQRVLEGVKAAAKAGAGGAFYEGTTEAAQQVIEEIGTSYETGTPIQPGLLMRMAEAGVAGALLGGPAGTVGEVGRPGVPQIAEGEFATPAGEQALNVIQQREAGARGQIVGTPTSIESLRQSKLPARPVVPSDEDRPTRPQLVSPTPAPVDRTGGEESFTIPKGKVTSKFGPRQTFKTANGQMASSNHAGIDIALPSGAPVPVGASGVVVFAGKKGGYGNQVVVQHSDGTTSSYSHLSKIGVEQGEQVSQGEVVGKVGATGNATGPHLHLERRDRQGRAVNPSNGAIVATNRNPETKEWEDDTEYAESQDEIDNFYDDMLDQNEADAAFTAATGQQWDDADFEQAESQQVPLGRGGTAPEEAPAPGRDIFGPQPETQSIRRGAALEALGETEVPEPAIEQETRSAELTEAKDRNPAAQELINERVITEEAAAPEGDYFNVLPGEEPIFASDEETGVATQEVVGFINTETQATRAIGEPPAAASSPLGAAAEPTPEDLGPSTPASVQTEDEVLAQRRDYAEREDTALYGLPRAEREAIAETLPEPGPKAGPDTVSGRALGQSLALGLVTEEDVDLANASKAFKTAFNVGLKEGKNALAAAVAGQNAPAGVNVEATFSPEAAVATAPAEAAATEFISAPPSTSLVTDIDATYDAIEEKLFDLEVDDVTKSAVKKYAQSLVKKGVLTQADVASLDYLMKDRDMGVEDVTSEVRSMVQNWHDEQKATPAFRSRRTGKVPKSKRLEDIIPGYAKVVKYLAPDEQARMKRSAARKLTDLYDSLPSPTEMAAVAISARDARGWYENSAAAISQVFGHDDGVRFAALLASTSPQNSVQLNLYNALKIWTAWNRAGRPTDRKSIVKIMGENVAGEKGLGSVLNAWINNTVTSLSGDIDQLVLSGPKVNSFFANLIGEVDEVTNDTWMATFAGVPAKVLQGTTRRGGGAVKSIGYMAYSARVRKAAEVASRRTGDKWTPAEIQETVWSWAKTVYEMRDKAGENRTIRQMLDAGSVTTEDIANTEDFALLFTQGVFANILEEGGYGQPTGIPKRGGANAPVTGGARPVTVAEGTGFTERDFTRNLRRAGDRLERARQERRGVGSERGKPQGAGSQQAQARGFREQRSVPRSQEPVAVNRGQELGFDKPLPGQPQTVEVPGYGKVAFGPLPVAQQAAADYMASIGQTYTPTKVAPTLNTERATRIAASFDAMTHAPQDPEVAAAYKAMIDETVAQWKAIEKTGLKVEFIDLTKTGDPYAATPRLMQIDVAENNHMWVFKTDDGFGTDDTIDVSDNPMLALTEINIDGHQLRANDVFRIVHDYFGHVKDGHGFRAKGEEGAWQAHSQMYSPLARRALTTETRGQNSWVNFGPSGETNRDASSAETVYAPQKVGLLPEWAVEEGALAAPAFKEKVDEQGTEPRGREGDDQGREGTSELERPPVNEDGTVTLQHYSSAQDLTSTDPTMWGATRQAFSREERTYMEKAPPRTYFGIATGQPGGYKQEFVGRREYVAKVPVERLYDVASDPDSLWVRGKPHIGERNIKEAGHAGYWHKNPELGLVAVVFEPVPVEAGAAPAAVDRKSVFEKVAAKRAFREETLQTVLATLKEMGIDPATRSDLKLEVIGDFAGRTYEGRYYYPQNFQDHPLIRIVALERGNASQSTRHEVIHWMRDPAVGIISNSEWAYLAKWAKNNPSLMAWAKANYPTKEGFTLDDQIEEAVAEGFSRWNGGDPALVSMSEGPVATVFARIREIIRKIREAFGRASITRGEINEAARILTAIRSGEQVAKFDRKAEPEGRRFGRKGITFKDQSAWHGSRVVDIDSFSLDFIGQGEGAQAFGWGLYFAQKQDVADWYRRKLTMETNSPTSRAVKVGGQSIAEWTLDRFGPGYGTAMVEVADRLHTYLVQNKPYNGWVDALQVGFEKDMAGYMADAEANNDQAEVEALTNEGRKIEQLFDSLRMKDIKVDHGPSAGALYKVEVPENEDLLDLDGTLESQPPKVKKALEKVRGQMEEQGVLDEYEEQMGDDFWQWTGHELQQKALKRMGYDGVFPFEEDSQLETALENGELAKASSLYLRSLGIPGNRYLDRDSRTIEATGGKTSNFVIFDDGVVTITRKDVPRQYRDRVVRDPQLGPLSDPTVPNPGIFRRIHDQTMAMLTTLGSSQGKGDWDAADSAIDAFRRKVTQRYQQVIKTQRRAAAELGVDRLAPGQNPMEMITADERGYKLQHLTENMIRPMSQVMATRGIDMDDLGLYLYARHAPARNARIAKINPAFRAPDKPGSGMTNIEAADIMATFVAEGKDADLAAAAVYIDRMIEMAQQERLQAGLLTQDALDAGFQPQDHYVPLRGNEQIEPEMEMDFPLAARKGGGFSVAGGEAHRMFGRESRANLEEIVGYTITQAQEAIDRAYRNKVATSMLEMFRAVPDPNFVQIDRVRRVPVMKGGQVEYQMQTRMNDPLEQQRTIFVKEGDVIHKMTFNQKNPSAMRFVKAAKNLGVQELNRGLQLISVFTRLWSKSNTQWNVDFILSNAAKDIQTGVINASTLNQKGLRRAMIKNIVSLKPLMASLMGSTHPAGAGAASANPWFRTYAEFEANGGKLNYGQITPLEDAIREAKREIKNAKRSVIHPIKLATTALGWIDHVNSGFENMTRLAAYKALRDAGIPAKQAAEAVRELTTNFQQHGEWGPKINAAYGFANASVIGGARFLKSVATNPFILTGLIAAGMIEDILNHMLDDDEWDRYTEEDKHANFMLMLPEEFGFDLKVPAGYGLNAFITTGRKMSELWRGKKNKDGTPMSMWDAGSDVMMGFVNAFAPITGATGFNILAPTFLDPIVNIYQNQNNWGRPIMPPQAFRKEQEKPDSQLAFDNTSQFWKSMATGLNAMGGGNEVVSGIAPLDVSPESLKHVTEETVGGMGRTFMRTVKLLDALATGKDIGPNDIPIVRRFAGLPYGAASTKEEQTGAFYDRINEARVVLAQSKELYLRFGADSPEFKEFKEANGPIIAFREDAEAAEKRLRALNTAENAAERGVVRAEGLNKRDRKALFKVTGYMAPHGKPIPEDKLAKIKQKIKDEKAELATKFNDRWLEKVMGEPSEENPPTGSPQSP